MIAEDIGRGFPSAGDALEALEQSPAFGAACRRVLVLVKQMHGIRGKSAEGAEGGRQ